MTLNRSLFFTVVGLLFAVLLVPLFVSNTLFFPFITGKNFSFRILVEIAALLWVVLLLREAQYRPKFSWLAISVVTFVAIVGIADIFSANPIKSFLSNFERMEGWITMAHLLVYFLMLGTLLKKWSIWEKFLQTSVAVSVISCIYGFMQLGGVAAIHQSSTRLDASFGNSAYLAIYMLFHVFITIILLNRWIKRRYFGLPWYQDPLVYIYAVIIAMQASVLFFTATRGSILGLLGGFIIAGILVAITERENRTLRKVSIGILIGLVAIVGLFFLIKNTAFVQHNEVLSRFSSISLSDNTTKSRFMIWNMAWQGVTDSPKHFLIGWGQESFNYIFNKYYNPGMYAQEQWFDRAHDIVFDWLSASGVLGLLAYFAMFGLTLYSVWRKSKFSPLEKSLITGLLAGYLFHNIFVFDNITSYIMFFAVMAFVHSSEVEEVEIASKKNNLKNVNSAEKQAKEIDETFQYAGMLLAGIAFIFIFYQYDYKPIAANTILIKALTQTQLAPVGNNQPAIVYTADNVQAFKTAISYNTIGLYETREQLFDTAQKAVSGSSENKVKQDLVNLAEQQFTEQLKETPNDVRYYVLGGTFLQNIGDYKNAAIYLLKAQTISPKKQSILFALGSNYFALNNGVDALATFKKAYELDTTYGEAKTLYALVAFYVGQTKITDSLLGPGPIMDPRFLSVYKATKHYDLMIAYLENGVTQNPTDIQARLSLADGYVIVGSITKAVSTLQFIKTLTADPSAATQIDAWIKDVKAGKNPFENPAPVATK